jgi:hypothetical protein
MKRTCLVALAAASTVLFAPRAFAQGADGSQTQATSGDAANGSSANTGTNTNASSSTSATTGGSSTAPTEESATDVIEKKGQGYYFLGANYRMNIVPAFLINLFVDQGPSTVVTSTAGLSFDYRKDHFSIVTGLNFTEYGMGDVLFLQKGKDPSDPGNWGLVSSSLKAIYLTVDLLWSVPIAKKGQVDFEFGFSAGLGGVFGDLFNTWVSRDAAAGGPSYPSQASGNFYQCAQVPGANGVAPGNGSLPQGCNTNNHQNAQISKTGPGTGYREPNWFDNGGGSVPTVFPWLSLPIIGLRFKPIKQLEMRLNGGFSLTGFFVNFAAYYGFESTKSAPQ